MQRPAVGGQLKESNDLPQCLVCNQTSSYGWVCASRDLFGLKVTHKEGHCTAA